VHQLIGKRTSKKISERSSQLTKEKGANMLEKVIKSDKEWRKILTTEQYRITRKKGTERAFSCVTDVTPTLDMYFTTGHHPQDFATASTPWP